MSDILMTKPIPRIPRRGKRVVKTMVRGIVKGATFYTLASRVERVVNRRDRLLDEARKLEKLAINRLRSEGLSLGRTADIVATNLRREAQAIRRSAYAEDRTLSALRRKIHAREVARGHKIIARARRKYKPAYHFDQRTSPKRK